MSLLSSPLSVPLVLLALAGVPSVALVGSCGSVLAFRIRCWCALASGRQRGRGRWPGLPPRAVAGRRRRASGGFPCQRCLVAVRSPRLSAPALRSPSQRGRRGHGSSGHRLGAHPCSPAGSWCRGRGRAAARLRPLFVRTGLLKRGLRRCARCLKASFPIPNHHGAARAERRQWKRHHKGSAVQMVQGITVSTPRAATARMGERLRQYGCVVVFIIVVARSLLILPPCPALARAVVAPHRSLRAGLRTPSCRAGQGHAASQAPCDATCQRAFGAGYAAGGGCSASPARAVPWASSFISGVCRGSLFFSASGPACSVAGGVPGPGSCSCVSGCAVLAARALSPGAALRCVLVRSALVWLGAGGRAAVRAALLWLRFVARRWCGAAVRGARWWLVRVLLPLLGCGGPVGGGCGRCGVRLAVGGLVGLRVARAGGGSPVAARLRAAVLSLRLSARLWSLSLRSGVLGGRGAGHRRGCGLRRRLLVAAGTVRPGRSLFVPGLVVGGGVCPALSWAVRRRPAVRSPRWPGLGRVGAGVVAVVVGRVVVPGVGRGARRPGFFRAPNQPPSTPHVSELRRSPAQTR